MTSLIVLSWLSIAAWVYRDAQFRRADGQAYPAVGVLPPVGWTLLALVVPGFGALSYVRARRVTSGDSQPLPSRWQLVGTPCGWLTLVIGGFLLGTVWSAPSSTALVAVSVIPKPVVGPMAWGKEQRLTASVAEMRFAVTGHERQSVIRYGTGETRAAGQFLIVHLAVRNTGHQPETLMPSRFSLVDSAGRHYTSSFAGETAVLFKTGQSLMLEPFQPGLDRTGDVVFDLPESARQVSLTIQGPDMLSSTAVLPVS